MDIEQDHLRALLVRQAHAMVGGARLEDVVALGAQGGGRIRPRSDGATAA